MSSGLIYELTCAVTAMRCKRKMSHFLEMKPTTSLVTNNVFDAETTKILASAFEAAWEEVKKSHGSPAGQRYLAETRELLAKHIMALAQRGERNPNRLIKNALRRLGQEDG